MKKPFSYLKKVLKKMIARNKKSSKKNKKIKIIRIIKF